MPCDENTAWELWTGYRDHGIMARAGGLLDQPRWWRSLIRFFDNRHAPIHAAYMAEERSHNGTSEREGDYDGEPAAQGFDALMAR